MQYFYCLIINILDNFSESFLDLLQLAQAIVIDSISMNFYIAEPVTRLPLFNFLVRYIFTEVLWKGKPGILRKDDFFPLPPTEVG